MMKDIGYSIRVLTKSPGFASIVIITLGLALGANTAIFSLVNTVLLRALPFRDPERLVSISKRAGEGGMPGLAGYQYLAWVQQI